MARVSSALRALARRRAYLGAIAAAGMLLQLVLVTLLGLAALVVRLLPAEWGAGPVVVTLAVVAFLPVLALVLLFLRLSVRAYTFYAAGPPPPGAASVRVQRGPGPMQVRLFRMLADPAAAAQGPPVGVGLTLPSTKGKPTRGGGALGWGLVLGGIAAWRAVAMLAPGLGTLVLAVLVVWVPIALLLGAAVKGVLAGAWDRFVAERMAAEAQGALGAWAGLGGPGPGT